MFELYYTQTHKAQKAIKPSPHIKKICTVHDNLQYCGGNKKTPESPNKMTYCNRS